MYTGLEEVITALQSNIGTSNGILHLNSVCDSLLPLATICILDVLTYLEEMYPINTWNPQ